MRLLRLAVSSLLSVAIVACSAPDAVVPDDGIDEDTGTSTDSGIGDTATDGVSDGSDSKPSNPRGFPATAPWVAFYGTAAEMGDLKKAADTFRIFDIDVDPGDGSSANFTKDQIATLKAGGKNRVISYLNLGACENYRTYWDTVPSGFVSCKANTKAQRGAYEGYPDETWMDVGDADYQKLIVEHVAPRLVAMGVDGFFFDNLEIVEHGTAATNGPCDPACAQGGLDLVRMLRAKFPDLLFVMQNATSDATLDGMTGGVSFPSLLDGISHEEVYTPLPGGSPTSIAELEAWKTLGLKPGGKPFFLGSEDYVGGCTNGKDAKTVYDKSRAAGFSPYATDASGAQKVVCYWGF